MQELISIGNLIIDKLAVLKRPVAESLNDGLSESALVDRESHFPFSFPEEVKFLYSWKNGTKVKEGALLDDLHFFPGFYFLSLEDALEHYQNFIGDPRWDVNWLPVFANGGGDFYCVVCNPESGEGHQILGFMLGEPEHDIEYVSLTSMLMTINEAYQENAYYIDERGYLEVEPDKEIAVARKYNPDLDYWNT